MHPVKVKFLKMGLNRLSKKRLKYYLDFVFFAIGFAISSGLALLITILINKHLSPAQLGAYSYNKAALELLAMIFTLTVHRSYLRFNTKGKSVVLKNFVNKIILIAVVLLIIAAYILTKSFWPCLFAFFVVFEERQYLTRSLMQLKSLNFLKIGAAFITVLVLGGLVYLNKLTDDLALFAYGSGFFLALFFNAKSSKIVEDQEVLKVKTILLFSLPALGAILVKLSFDFAGQFFLKLYFDYEEVAKYAIGLRVLLGVKLFSSLLMMFYPMVYYREMENKNKAAIIKLRWAMFGVMTIMSMLGYAFADQIFIIMGASKYLANTYVFRILLFSEYFFLIGNVLGTYLSFALKTHMSLLIVLGGALINITIVLLFMKEGGIKVAAYGVLLANLFMMLAHLLISFRLEKRYFLTK